MADGITIRDTFEVILFKSEATENVDASPSASADAIPFNAGSWSNGIGTKIIENPEVTSSYAAAGPMIAGQLAPLSFSFQVKGAGAGTVYSGSVKPPHDAVFAAAGMRGVFSDVIAAAALSAGTSISGTLGTGFATTAQIYRGMPFSVAAGPNSGELLLCTDYTSGKVATFGDLLTTALTSSSTLSLLKNWTYAPTSPASPSARLTDHVPATVWRYFDGKLRKFTGVRGYVSFQGKASGAIVATFTGFGTFAGESDASVPATPNLATNVAPLVLQGSNISEAFLINRRALAISQFTLDPGVTLEQPEDPNSAAGYMAAIIAGRKPVFSCDPYQTLVANRDTLGDIATAGTFPGIIRAGYASGNRVGLVMPRMQPVDRADGARGSLISETVQYRVLNPPAQDSNTRDNDFVLTFY